MTRDVKIFCNRCVICQKAKPKWQVAQVAMDVATLTWGDGEYRYLLVMVDLFSHYIELAPLHNQTADTIVEEFKRSWIYRGHGVPKILLIDQGHNVDGREVRNMCETLGVEKRHATAYHSQADGMAERSIGTVKQTIRCLLLEREDGTRIMAEEIRNQFSS